LSENQSASGCDMRSQVPGCIEHTPVLLDESMHFLNPSPGCSYLDCTAGGGGHSEKILELSSPDGRLVIVDRDSEALRISRERLSPYLDRLNSCQVNFADLPRLLEPNDLFDGIILDLGFSSLQLECGRGFSYMKDEPLDMRMDQTDGISARDLVNHLSRDELSLVFRSYGEERRSRKIADAVVRARERNEIRTTAELAAAVRKAADPRYVVKTLARVFQSIRIRVNDELSSLETGLPVLLERLKPGGTIVVIAYHSLEDRIVKRFFIAAEIEREEGRRLTKKVVKPTEEEKKVNPRSRSARLRAFRRIEGGTGS